MKIEYEDKSFLEIKLGKPGYIDICIAYRDPQNITKLQVISDSISIQDFATAIKDLGIILPTV